MSSLVWAVFPASVVVLIWVLCLVTASGVLYKGLRALALYLLTLILLVCLVVSTRLDELRAGLNLGAR